MAIQRRLTDSPPPLPLDGAPVGPGARFEYRDVTALPTELIEKILSYQSFRDIVVCRQVCRRWQAISDAVSLPARALYRDCYPYVPFVLAEQSAENDYLSIRNRLLSLGEKGKESVSRLDGLLASRRLYFGQELCYAVSSLLIQNKFFDPKSVYTVVHPDPVGGICLNSDGSRMASVSYSRRLPFREIIVHGYGDGEWQQQHRISIFGQLEGCQLSPDGRHLAAICCDDNRPTQTIRIWGEADGEWRERLPFHTEYREPNGASMKLRFSPCGQYLVILAARIQILRHIAGRWQQQQTSEELSNPYDVVFSPDKHHLLVTFHNNTFVVFHCIDGTWGEQGTTGRCEWPTEPSFSPTGEHFAIIDQRVVIIWSLVAGQWQLQTRIRGFRSGGQLKNIHELIFNAAGHLILPYRNKTLAIWTYAEGEWRITADLGPSGYFANVRLSPDGKHFAMHTGNTLIISVLDGGQLQQRAKINHTDGLFNALFTADGQHLITCQRTTARIFWQFDGIWQEKQSIEHDRGRVHIISSGDYILIACKNDCVVQLWQPWRLRSTAYQEIIDSWRAPVVPVEEQPIR